MDPLADAKEDGMRRSIPAVVLAAVLLLAGATAVRACSLCRCDDPATIITGSSLFAVRSWRASFETEVFRKDQAGETDEGGGVVPREREDETRYTLSGTWAPAPHWSFVGRLPWSARRIESGEGVAKRSGLADPELLANWCVYDQQGIAHPLWVTVQAGVRAPWGANDLESNDVRLDEHLQPGTGAAGGSAGLSVFTRLGDRDVAYATSFGRWNGANRHGYRYGDAWITSLAWQHEIRSAVQGGLDLTWRDAGVDREGGEIVPITGGRVLYVTPRAQLRLSSRLSVRLGVQIPAARSLHGDQRELTNFQSSVVLLP
jgi:hypothetical protein